MVKLVLLKKPTEGVSRDELIEYLRTVHGPHNASLPGNDYSLSVQVDPDDEDAIPDDMEYYDESETIPVDPEDTEYDSLEIHEFETVEDLIEAHSTESAQEAADKLDEMIDFEEEIAFVVDDEQIEL
ncbi:hypothetical protein NDI56_17170 [Haloarcula sp. S1CR25-12]|uniref:EthD domain-containing protein n=1 Tax=Haloarcula saliterrae TaxID=2950534 RepID=A0ABU2FFU1_9EURY|nr:hypothetical protein [Haloarcula sp. S1CR25-12]MDS0261133.1 hypothetical protein [Haloarcula sp. S1CR25-12]